MGTGFVPTAGGSDFLTSDERVIQILSSLAPERLLRLIPGEWQAVLQAAELEGSSVLDSAALGRALVMIWGTDLFANTYLRRELLLSLSSSQLGVLARAYLDSPPQKDADLALRLSRLPWKAGAKFVVAFSELLGIPRPYQPARENGIAATEFVKPIGTIHPLRDYQKDAVEAALEILNQRGDKAVLQLPTGAGKTRVAIEICCEFLLKATGNASVLWLAHTRELCEQALEAFARSWTVRGDATARVSRLYGGLKPAIDGGLESQFIVATYSTVASKMEKSPEVKAFFETQLILTIADEAHKSVSRAFSRVVTAAEKCAPVLGLTATPGRGGGDGEIRDRLPRFFQHRLIQPIGSEDPVAYLQGQGVLSELVRVRIETEQGVELSVSEISHAEREGDLSGGFLNRLGNNHARNRVIVRTIRRLVDEGHRVLVFSCSVAHSRTLAAALSLHGIRATHIDGEMSAGARRSAIVGFGNGERNVLVNFGVLSTGYDEPKISALVITRPTLSPVLYSQMVGRGLRGPKAGGTEKCLLIDVVDNFENYQDIETVYKRFREPWRQ